MGYIGNSPALNESVDTAQLKSPLTGDLAIGGDTDGTDRIFTFGHSTLKSVIGIDDDQDVFAINTDNAFEAANDLEINASGNITVPGTLTSGAITSAAAFTLGSGSQFKEVARGTLASLAISTYTDIYTSIGGTEDGQWLIFSHLSSAAGRGMFVAHSANGGGTHEETHLSNSNIGFRWDGDDFQLQQTVGGTPNLEFTVYQMDKDH